jgi:hypothetical protein
MDGEGIQLDERAGVEQQIDALAGGQLAAGVLLFGCLWVGGAGLRAAAAQVLDALVRGFHINLLRYLLPNSAGRRGLRAAGR